MSTFVKEELTEEQKKARDSMLEVAKRHIKEKESELKELEGELANFKENHKDVLTKRQELVTGINEIKREIELISKSAKDLSQTNGTFMVKERSCI